MFLATIVATVVLTLSLAARLVSGEVSLGDAAWMTEVAGAYGAPQLFREQLMIGASRGSPTTLPAGTIFAWLVENGGRARRVQTHTSLTGWRYIGDIAGQEVIFFYPADQSFLFAVVEKPQPAPTAPSRPRMTVPQQAPPPGVLEQKFAPVPEKKYGRTGGTIEVPPME